MRLNTGLSRSHQVARVQQKIYSLADAHYHMAKAIPEEVNRAIGTGERVAPETSEAIRKFAKAYSRCAKELERIALSLEPFTLELSYSQTEEGDYAEL